METRFILPVAVATALHAFVLLGVKYPHASHDVISPVHSTLVQPPPFPVDLEPPTVSEKETTTAAVPPKGEPAEFKPRLDEPPLRPADIVEPAEPRTPPSTKIVERILFGPVGELPGIEGASSDVQIVPSNWLDNTPRTKSQVAPVYPSAERIAGISGEVLVEFLVDEGGRVQHAHVVRSSNAAFESSTLRAVERWRFEPGTKNGRAVRFRMVVPVAFNLDQ
jgi:protein TonB